MRSLLFVLLFQISFLQGQEIVLLYGSGSAGKSTFSRELLNHNPNLSVIDEDDVFIETYLKNISNYFPDEYKIVADNLPYENLFQAIKNNVMVFPEDSTYSQKKAVKDAVEIIQNKLVENYSSEVRKKVFQQCEMQTANLIREQLAENKSIILDRWHMTPEMLQVSFPDIRIKTVLVFSPLQNTLNNFNKRNEKALQTGNAYSYRLYKCLIPSYVSLYKLSDEATNSLYCYNRAEIENIFNNVRNALLHESSESKKFVSFVDMTKEGLDNLREAFIPVEGDKLFLTPIDNYDFIVNTQIPDSKKEVFEYLTTLE